MTSPGRTTPPGQPYVWIAADRAARIRTTCARTGRTVLVLSVLLAAATAVSSFTLPSGSGFLGSIALATGVTGAGLAALSGTGLSGGPSHLWGEFINAARARTTRRVLLLLWIVTILVALFSYVGMVMVTRDSDVDAGPAVIALYFVPAAYCALAAVSFVTANRLLRPA